MLREEFRSAVQGSKIPILTLDKKWYQLFSHFRSHPLAEGIEALNALLKEQGRCNTEIKDIKRLKQQLMEEIVPMVGDMESSQDPELEQRLEQNKRLIQECNEKLEAHQDALLDLPREIEARNFDLMLDTLEICKEQIDRDRQDIEEIGLWVDAIRVELKKKLIEKQDKEQRAKDMYAYMHDLFGPSVIDVFDRQEEAGEKA